MGVRVSRSINSLKQKPEIFKAGIVEIIEDDHYGSHLLLLRLNYVLLNIRWHKSSCRAIIIKSGWVMQTGIISELRLTAGLSKEVRKLPGCAHRKSINFYWNRINTGHGTNTLIYV